MKNRHAIRQPKAIQHSDQDWKAWLKKIKNFVKPSTNFILAERELDSRPYLSVKIGEIEIKGLVDSGSSSTLINFNTWKKIKHLSLIKKEVAHKHSITTADGHVTDIDLIITVPFSINGRAYLIETLLVNNLASELIFGMDFLSKFQIIPNFAKKTYEFASNCPTYSIIDKTNLSAEQHTALNEVTDVFFEKQKDELGVTNLIKHKIDTGNAVPLKQRYYPVSPKIQNFIDTELDDMLKQGIVEPSKSPWSSPIVVVKKSSDKYRFCIDFRKVNKVSKKDAYPLPYITTILDKLGGAKYLSSIDLKSAFWQIPLEDTSREKTAFTVPGRGLFQFTRMPFGLCGAPATFQRLVDEILGPDFEPFVFVYLDDIIIVTPDFETHLRMIELVLNRIKAANLTINKEKCMFARKELKYLGYVVDRLRVDPDKISAIISFPTPRCPKDIRRFVGIASWYRRFIPDFSFKISPLTNLTRKRTPWAWTEETEKSFNLLKSCLTTAPILSCPDFTRTFTIQTDASTVALGAVLTQDFEDGERVIAYASRTLNKNEQNYCTTELEVLAVLWAVEKFRAYIEATHFKIITDHAALVWINNLKEPRGRLCRWTLKLQQYDFEVIHRKGKLNVVPDALSRTVYVVQISERDHDKWYKNMLTRVVQSPENFSYWKVENNQLFKFCKLINLLDPDEDPWKLVVPKTLRNFILTENHDIPTSGHFGILKTKCRIATKYYWPGMMDDIIHYVRSCEVCQAQKVEQKLPAGMLGKRNVTRPWQYICTDVIGPLPMSMSKQKYLLVVCDMFTKYTQCFAIRTADSKTICKLLEEKIFLVYGTPDYLICDNGRQFTGTEFRALMIAYQVQPQYIANFHPSANPTERTNRVIKTLISSYISNNHREWDLHLAKLQFALNTAVHETTGFTPCFLNFGRELKDKGQGFPECRNKDIHFENRTKYANRVRVVEKLRATIQKRLDDAYRKYSQYYNVRRRQVNFAKNELVWKKHPVLSMGSKYFTAKLAPKYVKCRVTECLSDSRYRLEDLESRDLGVWHVSMMKPFVERTRN